MTNTTKSRPQLLNVADAASQLNVSTKTVRRLIDAGALPAHRIGRCLRLSQDDIRGYLNRTWDCRPLAGM